METKAKCTACGSGRIMPNVRVVDRGHYSAEDELVLAMDANPDALLFKEPVRQRVRAWVCVDCGHVEWFVERS